MVIKFDFYVMILQHLPNFFASTLKHKRYEQLESIFTFIFFRDFSLQL